MNLRNQWALIQVLWMRDLLHFVRRPARLIVAFLQPILFWIIIGGGFSSTFRLPEATTLQYEEYFYLF